MGGDRECGERTSRFRAYVTGGLVVPLSGVGTQKGNQFESLIVLILPRKQII